MLLIARVCRYLLRQTRLKDQSNILAMGLGEDMVSSSISVQCSLTDLSLDFLEVGLFVCSPVVRSG